MTLRSTLAAAAALTSLALAAPSQAATNLLVNGGFEATSLAPGDYTYPTHGSTVDGWFYFGPAIVDGTGASAWWPNGPAVVGFEGDNFAALQTTGVIAQNFTLTTGTLELSWLDAGRPYSYGCCNGDQTYQVLLYNYATASMTTVGQYATFSGQQFTQQSATVSGLSGGNYALVFQGLTADRDETAFIDNVSAMAVPEPATWALTILGFGGVGAMLRRRRVLATAA